VALVGSACFAASALLLPIFSEYGLAEDYISELAIGRFGFVQTIAFFMLGLGTLGLAAGICEATKRSWGSLVGSALLGLFGVGLILDAVFPIDRGVTPQTTSGAIHLIVALLAFVCVTLGMFVLTRTFKQAPRWQSYWPVSLVLALGALAALFLPSEGAWAGPFQRIFIGIIITWMVPAAIRLRSVADGTSAQQLPRVR